MSGSGTEFFTAGDLVISVYGDGAGTGTYTDNQAAPIVLEELTTGGDDVAQLELPQTTTTNAAGVTENAISGEYGSSSEGSLELSADGQSLVLAGYGVNADTYNEGGAAVYGNAALAQSTSILGGQYTAVQRVIADIRADGTVDTSTALYNVFNTNNPRSVATVNGSSFYISGQGVKGDKTQGVFLAQDGATSASAIDTSTDTRGLEIHNGALYVSRDSKQGSGGTSNISTYGTEPTGATAPTTLSGISGSIKLTAAEENSVNAASVGKTVDLSPENFFFANATTLYIADSGNPKEGTIGDGGLQKWTLNTSTGNWSLDYTLSTGLNLVANTASSGTTGLIGLTGTVVGNTVTLYATNATIGDLDQTYLYGITDTLSATSETGETFTTLATAAPDTNIRGVSFAPSDAPCFTAGTRIRTLAGEIPVEDLRAGDTAVTRSGGCDVLARIVWIGERRVDVAAHPRPDHVRPVRIAPGALADGVPGRALRLSPDHALLQDGVLVAARQLVNGASITIEDCTVVHYFHVELERHGILLAEGAEAESYLDTDNRHQFADAGPALSLHPEFGRADHAAACAPLVTDASIVRPIWQRLADRGGYLPSGRRITRDAELRLLLPDGTRIAPNAIDPSGRHVFWLDRAGFAAETVVRLCSRHEAPFRIHPWLDDRRALGVAVSGLVLWTRIGGLKPVECAIDHSSLQGGWWQSEPATGLRWTDGDACVLLPAGCLRVDVLVGATMEYCLYGNAEGSGNAEDLAAQPMMAHGQAA